MSSVSTQPMTYFGLASLITGIVSILFLGASYGITVLDISPRTFSILNQVMYLVYCGSTPLAAVLSILSFTRGNDSRVLSVVSLGVVGLPFLILFWQFVDMLITYN